MNFTGEVGDTDQWRWHSNKKMSKKARTMGENKNRVVIIGSIGEIRNGKYMVG